MIDVAGWTLEAQRAGTLAVATQLVEEGLVGDVHVGVVALLRGCSNGRVVVALLRGALECV